jgi:hypothetical protein
MQTFASKLYTEFGDFQIIGDTMDLARFDSEKSVIASIGLKN